MSDEAVADVPVGLLDHVGEEDGLDLVHEEDLGDGLEHLVDGVAEGDMAAAGDRPQDGDDRPDLAAGVIVVGDAVLGRHIGVILLFFVHFILWPAIIKLRTSYIVQIYGKLLKLSIKMRFVP